MKTLRWIFAIPLGIVAAGLTLAGSAALEAGVFHYHIRLFFTTYLLSYFLGFFLLVVITGTLSPAPKKYPVMAISLLVLLIGSILIVINLLDLASILNDRLIAASSNFAAITGATTGMGAVYYLFKKNWKSAPKADSAVGH